MRLFLSKAYLKMAKHHRAEFRLLSSDRATLIDQHKRNKAGPPFCKYNAFIVNVMANRGHYNFPCLTNPYPHPPRSPGRLWPNGPYTLGDVLYSITPPKLTQVNARVKKLNLRTDLQMLVKRISKLTHMFVQVAKSSKFHDRLMRFNNNRLFAIILCELHWVVSTCVGI